MSGFNYVDGSWKLDRIMEAKYSMMRELERRRYAFEQEDANTVPSLDSINVVDSDV